MKRGVAQVIFEYGAKMLNSQTSLVMGHITPEEAEKIQGAYTLEAMKKIEFLISSKKN